MKDMLGIKLEAGQHVLYFHLGPAGLVNELAEVIRIRPESIRVEFLGSLSYGKKKGDQSNIFNTTGKIFVLNKDTELERRGFINQIKELTEQNNQLKAEVEKIHNRFDIIDL